LWALRRSGALPIGLLKIAWPAIEKGRTYMPIEKSSGQTVVAHLIGDPHLTDELHAVLEQAATSPVNIILDLAGVRYITSSHIAKLLKLRKLTIAGERRLILCGVAPSVWTAFVVTGLDKIYEFAETIPAGQKMMETR